MSLTRRSKQMSPNMKLTLKTLILIVWIIIADVSSFAGTWKETDLDAKSISVTVLNNFSLTIPQDLPTGKAIESQLKTFQEIVAKLEFVENQLTIYKEKEVVYKENEELYNTTILLLKQQVTILKSISEDYAAKDSIRQEQLNLYMSMLDNYRKEVKILNDKLSRKDKYSNVKAVLSTLLGILIGRGI
jgi:hypothetical protein